MKRILLGLSLLTCMLSVAALPQEKTGNSPCDSTNSTQTEANACTRRKYEQTDAEMNRVYEQLMLELSGYTNDGKIQQKLERAQSLWLQYREASCESEASIYDGGSIRPAVYYSCLASITEERARRMKAFLAVTRQ
jgi:uncharacterized protein YecT (DUF1311 family)